MLKAGAETDVVELLAPARDLECGRAAVMCGADAIYIGAEHFGAREAAGNSLADIEALVGEAHPYWVKVYVTVNTLLYDQELPRVQRLIHALHAIGVDGLIIQDMGLLEPDLPPIPLIASTQMHNNTPEKAAFLEQAGFRRIILARELELDQIRAIRRAAPRLELECFIHGALCVSYSGQCSLSYAIGGRSANRGQCAQPCRRRYTLVDGTGRVLARDRHLLSIRDLNLSEGLGPLLEAGVRSFKIEGRLKEMPYVANAVAHYRRKLDPLIEARGLARSASGASQIGFTPDPDKTFNRGFTTYFLHGRRGKIGAPETPKMIGEIMGRVTRVKGGEVALDRDAPLVPGDGLAFFDGAGQLCGTAVNAAQGCTFRPDKTEGLAPGVTVHRNRDHAFLTAVRKSRMERRIGVQFTLRANEAGLVLSAEDEDGVHAEAAFAGPCPGAEKPEQAAETLRRNLGKTGGSMFRCDGVALDLTEIPFLPVGAINAFRRDALDRLLAARLAQRPLVPERIAQSDAPYPEKRLDFLGNVLNRKAEAFYRRHGVEELEHAAESGLDMSGRKVMTTRYCLKYELDLCPAEGADPKAVKEPLALVDEDGQRLTLRFNCRCCQMEVYFD